MSIKMCATVAMFDCVSLLGIGIGIGSSPPPIKYLIHAAPLTERNSFRAMNAASVSASVAAPKLPPTYYINVQGLSRYVGRTVRIVGKVVQVSTDGMRVQMEDADGAIATVIRPMVSVCAVVGRALICVLCVCALLSSQGCAPYSSQFVCSTGIVQHDLTIRESICESFGDNFSTHYEDISLMYSSIHAIVPLHASCLSTSLLSFSPCIFRLVQFPSDSQSHAQYAAVVCRALRLQQVRDRVMFHNKHDHLQLQGPTDGNAMTVVIIFYFDFLSPYSYLAFRILHEQLLPLWRKEIPVRLTLRPASLAHIIARSGNVPPGALPARRQHLLRDIQRTVHLHSLHPFHMPSVFPFDSKPALLALLQLLAEEREEREERREEQCRKFMTAVWTRIFQHGDTSFLHEADPTQLLRTLLTVDTPVSCDVSVLRTQLKQNTQEALDAGAFGVPFWIVECGDGNDKRTETFFGSDRFHHMARFISPTLPSCICRRAKL